jgi:hypothetical protein
MSGGAAAEALRRVISSRRLSRSELVGFLILTSSYHRGATSPLGGQPKLIDLLPASEHTAVPRVRAPCQSPACRLRLRNVGF